MYIYHALINALSAHMIHINLNMIFYTHVEHSPTKTIYIKYYTKKAIQTHTMTSRNWVLILGWKYCEKRKVFSLALKDDRVEQFVCRFYVLVVVVFYLQVQLKKKKEL